MYYTNKFQLIIGHRKVRFSFRPFDSSSSRWEKKAKKLLKEKL